MRRISKRVNKSIRRVSKRVNQSRRRTNRRKNRKEKNRKTRKQMKRSKINNKTNRQTGKRRNRRNKKNKMRNKKNYNNKQRGGVPLSGKGVYMLKDVTEEIKDMIDGRTKLPRQTYVYETAKYGGEGVPDGDWLLANGAVFFDIQRNITTRNEYIFIKGDGESLSLKLTSSDVLNDYTFLRYHYALPSGALGPGHTVLESRIIIDRLLLGAMINNQAMKEYVLLAPAGTYSPHPVNMIPESRYVQEDVQELPRRYTSLNDMLNPDLHSDLPAAINPDSLDIRWDF